MYKTKICPICGTEFQPKSSRQKYCNSPMTRTCVICGKEYLSECSQTYSKCCSKECKKQYAHQQSLASYAQNTRTCVLCGKEFTPKNNTNVVCPDQHYGTCAVCGTSFPIKWHSGMNISGIPKTCSTKCKTQLSFANGNPAKSPEAKAKARQTLLDRYGVDHPMHSAEIKAKVDNTMQERYGARRFTQTSEYIDKAKATNQLRYGADWARQNPEIQQKSEDTLLEHYGVTNPMQSEELKAKVSETYKERTGYEHPMQNPEVVQQIKDTNLSRYGVEYVMQNPDILDKAMESNKKRWGGIGLGSKIIQDKVMATNLDKYGVKNPASSPEVQNKISTTMHTKYGHARYSQTDVWHLDMMTDPTRLDYLNEFKQDPRSFITKYFDTKPTLEELYQITGVRHEGITTVLDKFNCRDAVAFNYSTLEREVANALISIDPNINILYNTHKIIYPYEIDIYLPDYHIGIECNPTVTHNSSVGFLNKDNSPKPKNYHKLKSDLAEQNNVFLFHIFGYDWKYHRDVIVSMLRNLLNKNTHKIFARNTYIKEVPAAVATDFLNNNHRQGSAQASVRLGLYDKTTDELVSLMTFGKMRGTIGTSDHEDTAEIWELVRFCNKRDTSVVGGASKLFKQFIQHNNPTQVRSFSDRAHTRGGLYQTLGFTELRRSDAGYVWVDIRTDAAYNRVNAQKRNLKRFLRDDQIDLSQTERQIMEEHGYVRIYDSGTITWEWVR